MEALPPQLWQVCVGTLRSGTPFEERRIPRCTICWSDSFCFVLSTGFYKNHQLSKSCHQVSCYEELLVLQIAKAIICSRDTSHECGCGFLQLYGFLTS